MVGERLRRLVDLHVFHGVRPLPRAKGWIGTRRVSDFGEQDRLVPRGRERLHAVAHACSAFTKLRESGAFFVGEWIERIDSDDVDLAEHHGVVDVVPIGRIRERSFVDRTYLAHEVGEHRRASARDPGAKLDAARQEVHLSLFGHFGPRLHETTVAVGPRLPAHVGLRIDQRAPLARFDPKMRHQHDLQTARVRGANRRGDGGAVVLERGLEPEVYTASGEVVHASERSDGDPRAAHRANFVERAQERRRSVPFAGVVGVFDRANRNAADGPGAQARGNREVGRRGLRGRTRVEEAHGPCRLSGRERQSQNGCEQGKKTPSHGRGL